MEIVKNFIRRWKVDHRREYIFFEERPGEQRGEKESQKETTDFYESSILFL